MADCQQDREWHQRLLDGEETASTELIEHHLDLLIQHLRSRFPENKDEDLFSEAAIDALLNYVKRPSQFDPGKRGLKGYLQMAAEGDFRNLKAKQTRHSKRTISLDSVELGGFAGNVMVQEDAFFESELGVEDLRNQVLALFESETDKRLVELLMDGVRETQPYARVLGLESKDIAFQREAVNRHKERLKKTIRRRWEKPE